MNKGNYIGIIIGLLLGRFLLHLFYSKKGQEFLSNLFNLIGRNMWIIFLIVVAIIIVYAASKQLSQTSLPSSTTNTSRRNIINTPPRITLEHIPDDIKNILEELVKDDIRDQVSQEPFRSGEKIHLCSVHKLAYHEDSWREMGCKCITCGHGGNTKVYTVPTPITFRNYANNQSQREEIKWIDIKKQ